MQHLLEALAVLGHVYHVRRGADDRNAILFQVARELEWRLPTVLDDHPERLLDVHDLQHILEREGLEVQAVGGIVVGRDGFWIAVDHDRFVPVFAQRKRGVHAAVVELDALPDPIRTAAEDHHLLSVGRLRFALVLVGRVHIGSPGREFRGAGVDALVHRPDPERVTARAHVGFRGLGQVRQSPVGEAHALERAQTSGRQVLELALLDFELGVDDFLDLCQKPAIDSGVRVDFFERHADRERVGDVPESLGARVRQLVGDGVRVDGLEIEPVDAGLEPAQCLLQRFLEGAADGHHFADRLHLRGQPVVGLLEFFEGEARHFGDHVVDRRLERGGCLAAGDVVLQFVERVADRELGRDLRDRETGRLGRQRGGARHARIHLDHDHPPVVGIDRELDVGAAGIDADLAQDRDRRVAHDLIFLVGERLRRRDGDRVAGMHAHRIQVLDRADDDAVVLFIAHHFHLELFPAEERFLDQKLARG